MSFVSSFRRLLIAFSIYSVTLSPGVWAHHGDETGNLGNLGNGYGLETGTMIELGHEQSPVHILVGATLPGLAQETGDHHVVYRYFWVSFRMFTPLGGPEARGIPMLGVNVTPVTRVQTQHDGSAWSLRFAPIEVRRDVGSEIEWSGSFQALGMAYSIDRPLEGEFKEGQKAQFEKFARIAVDLLGIRVAQTRDEALGENVFRGLQIGSVQALGGLRWNLTESSSLALTVGVRGGGALGARSPEAKFGSSHFYELDTFAQIQWLLQTAFTPLQLRLEGGYHLFGLSGEEDGHLHGHPYLAISAGTWF